MKRQLLTLCAAGLLAIPALAQTNSTGSTSTGSTSSTTNTNSTSGSSTNNTSGTASGYNSGTGYNSNMQSWDSWMTPTDRAARDRYFGTLSESDRSMMQRRLSGLSESDQRSYLNMANNMSAGDRDLWMRSMNSYSPYYGSSSYGSTSGGGNLGQTSYGTSSNWNTAQSDRDRYFGGMSPVDRTMAGQMWDRMSQSDRNVWTRMMQSNAYENMALNGLDSSNRSAFSRSLGNLSGSDQALALNLLQRLTPLEKRVLSQMITSGSMSGMMAGMSNSGSYSGTSSGQAGTGQTR